MHLAKLHLMTSVGVVGLFMSACGGAAATPRAVATPGPTARPPADPIKMQAPAEASPGETISVGRTGREQLGDGVYVVEAGWTRILATDDANGHNTALGSPGKLVAPSKAGATDGAVISPV